MDRQHQLMLYRAMLTARKIDQLEMEIINRGEAFFMVSGSGHEASAALACHLKPSDWLHCHYRDKALLLARGVSPQSFFDNLYCKDNSSSRGRQMYGFFSEPDLNVMSMCVPVGNNGLQAVGVAAVIKDQPEAPVVYCGMGDGATQEGEFLEACAEAVRANLPVLFVVHDNHFAISTRTRGQTFYSLPQGRNSQLFGIPIRYVNGRDVHEAYQIFGEIVGKIRESRSPALIVLDVERLHSHTNADDHSIYRSFEEIAHCLQSADPVSIFADWLLEHGWMQADLAKIQSEVELLVVQSDAVSFSGIDPEPIYEAKRPLKKNINLATIDLPESEIGDRLNMRDAIKTVLWNQLSGDQRVFLLGQDIEDPKGDVFGVTRGLSTAFPGRVMNAPLTEATIVGSAIGRAIAGQKPVAFIQFADFFLPGYNQVVSELATLHWRSGGRWNAPVILMVACGAYRPGLGPYHSQTFESLFTHIPGLDVFMPATAGDAAGLLNAAFESERPTIFLYPKSLLNNSELSTSYDLNFHFVPIGTARRVRSGRDLTMVCWGNTVLLCMKAAVALESAGYQTDVIDLRCLSPWDRSAVLASAEKTSRLIVVHEDNQTCGMGGEILATVAELSRVSVAMRRVARYDTHIPCNFVNQIEVLPSFKRLLSTAAELLNLSIRWTVPKKSENGIHMVEAIGSGPSDDAVTVVSLAIGPGCRVNRGEVLATLEASKSVFDMLSPVSGVIDAVLVNPGSSVNVGDPIMCIRTEPQSIRPKPVAQETCGTPVLSCKTRSSESYAISSTKNVIYRNRHLDVGFSLVTGVSGSRSVTNSEILKLGRLDRPTSWASDDIVRRTGITSRMWVQHGENAVSLASQACSQLLATERLQLADINLVICSTTSPTAITPSMACQVLSALTKNKVEHTIQAFDINAACSGYLYALQAGYDYLQSTPKGRVLLITAEVLSPLIDLDDVDTAFLFGDAATATVLYGEECFERAHVRLHRPVLSAKGENGRTLSVPLLNNGFIHMEGKKVFSEAVRQMVGSLNRTCDQHGFSINDMKMVIPHQANQRIIDAIQSRIGVPVYSNIRQYGNTSSSSIPMCLREVLLVTQEGDRLGLCAFGGGFTFGACILESKLRT